jgi:hypothetical protein
VSNQDIEGQAPAEQAPAAPAGTPAYFEQQLTKERDARALMRDRLRHTEALAAESHALRARMAEELERVTADRDRLRTAAATASTEAAVPAPAPAVASPMTPRLDDAPLRPPAPPPRRRGPWRALGMLGALAVAVGVLAWMTGSIPGWPDAGFLTAHDTPETASPAAVARTAPPPASAAVVAAAPALATAPSGPVALPPLTPEAQLAAAPTAAGPAPTAASVQAPAPAGLAARLRKALDDEGIAAPVDIDAASGHVVVSDSKPDAASRDRADMLIRAVYAGASLPDPQIEHRWMSPMHPAQAAAEAQPAAAPIVAAPDAARHAVAEVAGDRHARKVSASTVADAEELRPVLPEGRFTAACRASLAGHAPHRADMTACMSTSCCRPGAGQTEECRAYRRAYPFTCSAS